MAVLYPILKSHLRIVISLLTEYSSFSECNLNALTLLVCPLSVVHRFSFPESQTLITLSSPQDTILSCPLKRAIRMQESCLPITVLR